MLCAVAIVCLLPRLFLSSVVVSEYGLSKLVELWNHSADDGFVYYAFRPPWVRRRADESFFTLHPELAAPGAKMILPASGDNTQQRHITADDERRRITSGSAANSARGEA